jgi:hypothetical protein
MPIGIAAATLIAAGIATAGTALQARKQRKATASTNTQNINYDREMADRQRQQALDDRTHAEKYNDPKQQLQRLKEAGLNPNLIYGTSGNTGESPLVKSTPNKGVNLQAPQYNSKVPEIIGNSLIDYLNAKQIEASTKQTEASTTNLQQDLNLKTLDAVNKELKNKSDNLSYNIALSTKRDVLEQAAITTKTMNQNVELQAAKNIREQKQLDLNTIKTNSDIKAQAAQIVNLAASTAKTREEIQNVATMRKNMESTTLMNQITSELKQRGLDGSDPMGIKMIAISLTRGINAGLDFLKSLSK